MSGRTVDCLWAFLIGNQEKAENFAPHGEIPVEEWIEQAIGDPDVAEYAADVTKRAADALEGSVASLEGKASSLTNFATPLILVAITVLGFSIAALPGLWALIAVVAFAVVLCLLIAAAVRGYLASGARVTGAVNRRRLTKRGTTLGALRVTEADAWLVSSDLALHTIESRNRDLFAARRALTWAFLVAAIGAVALGLASNADSDNNNVSTLTVTVTKPMTFKLNGWTVSISPPHK